MSWFERAIRLGVRPFGLRGRMVDTGVARHHVYTAAGQGALPPVVFVPGLAATASSFIAVAMRVRPHVSSIVLVDNGGHGLSGAAASGYTVTRHLASMTALLDRLISRPALLVGNSMGGATAMHYANERPTQVCGLYLTSPAAIPFGDEARADIRRTFDMRTAADADAFITRVLHRRPALTPLFARMMLPRVRSSAVVDLLASMTDEYATPEALASLRMPTTLVWGRSERLLPASGLAYLREHMPGHVTIVEREGWGHCPHVDDPAGVAAGIVELARAAGARGGAQASS